MARHAALTVTLTASVVSAAGTPAVPVPQSRWGSLQPAIILEDATAFAGQTEPRNGDTKQYFDLDVANGYLFVSTGQGFEIFDVRTPPGNPGQPLSYIYGSDSGGAFPYWSHSDKDWYIYRMSVPAGVDSVAVLGMEEQGIAVVNTAVKSAPIVAYQRTVDVSSVYAFTAGGEQWAYAIGRTYGDVYRFNVTAAARLNRCLEMDADGALCSGVYGGKVTAFGSGNRPLHGVGSYLATSHYAGGWVVQMWDIAAPATPVLVGQISGRAAALAMWQASANTYLARLSFDGRTLSIFDVTCVTSGTCGTLVPISTELLSAPVAGLNFLTVSTDAGRPYLYVGSDDLGTCEPQREFLYDVSTPSQPTELTPDTDPDGYWGWYYMNCSTGFNLVGPRVGEVRGGYLYRAANSVLDVHRIIVPSPPSLGAVVAGLDPVEPCQVATFTVDSVGGNPAPTLAWRIEDASSQVVAPGGNVNPFSWTVPSAQPTGTYRAVVTATNANGALESPVAFTVAPLAPLAFTGPGQAPDNDPPNAAQVQLHLQSQGASEWAWDFDDDDDPATQVFGAYSTDPQSGPQPLHVYTSVGPKTVRAKIRNCQETNGVISNPRVIQIDRLQSLAITGFQPSSGVFPAGDFYFGTYLVPITFAESFDGPPQFYDYSWDGDLVYEDAGHPAPVTTHTYLVNGTFQPRLRARNDSESVSTQLGLPILVSDGPGSLAPGAPTALTATLLSATSVELAWTDNATNENSYHVELGIAGQWTEVTPPYGAGATQATLSGLDPDVAYTFRVRASNDAGYSGYSNAVTSSGFWNGFEDGSLLGAPGAAEPYWSQVSPLP